MFDPKIKEDEELFILIGKTFFGLWFGKTDMYRIGEPSAVTFDADFVLDHSEKVVGWVHTHPVCQASPSATDNATMKAWFTALGKPMVCCIEGTDGLRAHWYFDDESPSVEGRVFRIGKRLFGVKPKWLKNSTTK